MTKLKKPTNDGMYMVHRQPRWLVEMNAAIKGAVNGPMKTDIVYMAMAIPRWVLLNRSDRLAGTKAIGLAANSPEKKRHNMRVWVSLEVAQAMEKTLNPNMPMSSGGRRPYSSEPGAQIVGPAENPSTKRVVPKSPTTWPKPKDLPAPLAAGAKAALAKATTRAQKVRSEARAILGGVNSCDSGTQETRDYIPFGHGPVLGMHGIIRSLKFDNIIFGVRK